MKIPQIKLTFVLILSLLITACSSLPATTPRPTNWAKPISINSVDNIYQVDSQLYRSAQPSIGGMKALDKRGIKMILDLRYYHDDKDLIQGTSLTQKRLPMLAHDISQKELIQALQLIRQARKPVLVHCYHGSDRTGAVVAAYRIIEQHWSKQDAIREMQYGGYGYHYLLFPNIREILEEMDVDKVRQEVNRNP